MCTCWKPLNLKYGNDETFARCLYGDDDFQSKIYTAHTHTQYKSIVDDITNELIGDL